MTSRTRLTLLLFLGVPAALWAQKQQGSWSDLNRLKAGQGIEVIESRMQRHTGEFVTVTDQVLSLQEGGADVSIKRGATFSSFPHLRLAFGAFQG